MRVKDLSESEDNNGYALNQYMFIDNVSKHVLVVNANEAPRVGESIDIDSFCYNINAVLWYPDRKRVQTYLDGCVEKDIPCAIFFVEPAYDLQYVTDLTETCFKESK